MATMLVGQQSISRQRIRRDRVTTYPNGTEQRQTVRPVQTYSGYVSFGAQGFYYLYGKTRSDNIEMAEYAQIIVSTTSTVRPSICQLNL